MPTYYYYCHTCGIGFKTRCSVDPDRPRKGPLVKCNNNEHDPIEMESLGPWPDGKIILGDRKNFHNELQKLKREGIKYRPTEVKDG